LILSAGLASRPRSSTQNRKHDFTIASRFRRVAELRQSYGEAPDCARERCDGRGDREAAAQCGATVAR
jgi:hypothetical protein